MKTPPRPDVYDFGPGVVVAAPDSRMAPLPSLALAEVDAPVALETAAVLYRLAYSDAQQLRPYAQARWSMTPAQLLRQRLRAQLGQHRAVLNATLGMALPPPMMTLNVELEEFSQLFDAADRSTGLVRVRATLGQAGARVGSLELVAQRSFVVQRPAASADAQGGVRAMTAAADAIVLEIDQWVTQTQESIVPSSRVARP